MALNDKELQELQELEELELLEQEQGQKAPEIGAIEAAARGAASGATFGFADEIAAGVQAPFSPKTFEQLVEEARAANKAAEEQNPIAFNVGNIAGAVASPANKVIGAGVGALKLGSAAGRLSSGLKNTTNLAAEGAVGSALSSVGEEREDSLAGDVGLGAGLGALTGAAGGALGKIGKYVAENFEIAKYPKEAVRLLRELGLDVTKEKEARNVATKMARELGDDVSEAVSTVRKTAGSRLGQAKEAIPATKATDLDTGFEDLLTKVDELPKDSKESIFDTLEDILATDKSGNKIAKVKLSDTAELKFNDLLETQTKLNRDLKILEAKRLNKEPVSRDEIRLLQSAKNLVDAQINKAAQSSPEAFEAFTKANREFAEAATAQDLARIAPGQTSPDPKSLRRNIQREVLEDKRISETARQMGEGTFNAQTLEEALTENFSRSPELIEDILNQSLKQGPEAQTAAKALETMQTFGERGREIANIDDVISRVNREGIGAGLIGKTGSTATGLVARGAVAVAKKADQFAKSKIGQASSKIFNAVSTDANLQRIAQKARERGNEKVARLAENMLTLPAEKRRATAFVLQQNPAFREFADETLPDIIDTEEQD